MVSAFPTKSTGNLSFECTANYLPGTGNCSFECMRVIVSPGIPSNPVVFCAL